MLSDQQKPRDRLSTAEVLQFLREHGHSTLSRNILYKRIMALKSAGAIAPIKGKNNADLFTNRDAQTIAAVLEMERAENISTKEAVRRILDGEGESRFYALTRPQLLKLCDTLERENDSVKTMLTTIHTHIVRYLQSPWWKRILWAILTQRSPITQALAVILARRS